MQLLRNSMERAINDDQLSQQMATNMSAYYLEPVMPWYVCILFFGKRPNKKGESLRLEPMFSPLEQVTTMYQEILDNYGQSFFFEVGGTVGCLLNVELAEDPEYTPEAGKAFCSELRDALLEFYQMDMQRTNVSHIAISHVSRLEQGPRSLYRSAVSVAERRDAASPVVCMEEAWVSPTREALNQVFMLEPLFWRQIQQHSFFDAATTLDQLIQITTLDKGSLEQTKASVFSRMEMVLQTVLGENGNMSMQNQEFAQLLPMLTEASNYQEVRNAAYDVLATLEDRFYTPPNARNKKMDNIEAYIKENYRDQLMSATSIAEHFKISPSYLSRIFKADMGVGIVEYIHRIRVDAVLELLKDRSLTIDAVAVKAGFSNRWVLTRVFKRIIGMTPGMYRDRH